ncbi:Zn-dependent protease with chaperone function [Desulfobotulus alkaliphilus]|uniref:Zn-dependent protease with chaperone function n=1 Tax=Desulfobotulus alkaliphilus TaxID=622671 RepID=A0A562RD18_9BACT|nr:M48 family metallopeptidase [Desulfobotulus alkaliphilus]TWI66971.1 Zn-dependent protease with chaperone function [Desulfobotulus alkaliphilus]
MFYQLFYTIAALILVTAWVPAADLRHSFTDWFHLLAACLLFFILSSLWNKKSLHKYRHLSPSGIAEKWHRRLQAQNLVLLIFFAFFVHGLHLPFLLCPRFLADLLPFLQDFFALAFYFALLWGLWHLASGSMASTRIIGEGDRQSFIREQMGLSLPALLPWFVLSGLHDFLMLLPFSGFRQAFSSSTGQTVYYLTVFTAIFLFAPLCVQKFWGCSPLPPGPLRHRIEKVLQDTKTGFKDILIWPLFGGRMLTAGIMGPWKKFRYILVTPALLQHLYPEELEAVIAHEAGHAHYRHLIFYVFILAGFLLVSWFFLDFLYQLLVLGPGLMLLSFFSFLSPAALATALGIFITLTLFILYFRFLFGYFMRHFERQADAFAFRVQGTARHLIQTFHTLSNMTGQNPDKPNWHHFSISQRIRFLEKCEKNPELAILHDRQVRGSVLLYLFFLILLTGAGGYMKWAGWDDSIQKTLLIRALEMEVHTEKKDPLLLRHLGDLYQEKKAYQKALSAYHRALSAGSRDADLFNNLAWLYITAEDSGVADPLLGTYFAEKAVHQKPEAPYILDTLAEGYHRTGRREEAVYYGRKALHYQKKSHGETDYYEKQLEKFLMDQGTE